MSARDAARSWLAVIALAVAAAAEVSAAPPIRRIEFDTPVPIDRRDYLHELPLREGEPLSEERIAESLRWLERKKIFAGVRAEVVSDDSRATVVFHLEPLPFVVGVAVEGEESVDEETLLRRARVREDEPLTPERLEAGKRRVIDLYVERGYPHAQVTSSVEVEEPGRVRVRLRIDEGTPLRITAIELEGIDGDLALAARKEVVPGVGAIGAHDAASNGRRSLVRFLRGHGYYEAEVVATQAIEGETLTIRHEVHLGPHFDLAVVGNEHVGTGELLGVTDLADRPIVTRGTWQMIAIRMQEHYRSLGYSFATVRASVSSGEPRTVRFEVREGPRVRVREVRFRGNRALSDGELRAALHVRPRRWFERFGPDWSLFREDLLNEDIEMTQRRYRELGYLAATIEEGPREFSADQQWVTLTLEIREGRRTVIGEVRVESGEGVAPVSPADLAVRSGDAYRDEDVEADRRLLKKRLGERGFIDARIDVARPDPVPDPAAEVDRVDVRYVIEPGTAVRVGHVIVQGNYFTRDSAVRQSLDFGTGDALDPDKLAKAQTDIYRLGLFRSVAVRALDDSGPVRDVGVEVGERPGGELVYGFGYDTRAGLRNFLQVAHQNVAGTGNRLSLRGDLNLAPTDLVPDEYIISLDGKQPHLLGSRTALKANATYQQSERSIDEFSIRRATFAFGPEREIRPGLRLGLSLEFQDSDIYDVAPDAVLTGQDVGKLRTVSVNPIVLFDGRDDAFKPTRGVFETLRLRYAAPAIGSDVHLFKLTVQHSQYVPIGPVTWIYSGRLGYALPIRKSNTIPIGERFFLGGRTSVRGFDENEIGPRGDDGDPIGGDFLVNLNTEIRFPLFFGLGGAVFVDAGGLYLRDRSISLDEVRESVGPGLRYQTPIGSISLDYGFKIDRRSGESIGEVHFTIGNIF